MKEKKIDSQNGQDSSFGNLIYAYTRQQAIQDGVLVAVDESLAQAAGFRIPVALTYAVWALAIPVPDHLKHDLEQSETGRLQDLLRVLEFYIYNRPFSEERLDFTLQLQQPDGTHRPLKLKAICAPGDDPRPVLTILLRDED
ncbi:MAG: DUF6573 family protein [Planctomycetaceae bacterium]